MANGVTIMTYNKKHPYHIVKSQYITEKSTVLSSLHTAESNRSLRACNAPKAVFIVDVNANKQEIARALLEIYRERNLTISKVNTINMKPKRRRVRGRSGKTAAFKKAIVTFAPNDDIENL